MMDEERSKQLHVHQDSELCRYLLDNIKTAHHLEIRQSNIPGAGSALFTATDIAEGEEIFRSRPLVSCVADNLGIVCDFCYRDGASKLHPSGRFRRREDPIEEFMVCGRCAACTYCSDSCRNNAWNAYHKFECRLLHDRPELPTKTRTLYRVLVRNRHGLYSDLAWRSLISMESHYAARIDGPNGDEIREISEEAIKRTGTDLSATEVERIYCVLLTNNICVRESGQAKLLGISLDVVMAMMNHSCDPNALTIFDGPELCVRSMKPIQAGEEILQCYADLTIDALMRHEQLKNQFFFTCSCSRCEMELADHRRNASNNASRIELVKQTQEQLTNLINDAIFKMMKSPDSLTAEELETTAVSLANAGFPGQGWPNYLDPMPLLWKRLGNISAIRGDIGAGLKYSIKGCAYTSVRFGLEWVNDLHDLIKLVVLAAIQPDDSPVYDDDVFPRSNELWDICMGYVRLLIRLSDKTFGAGSCYSRATRKWYNSILESTQQSPEVGTPDFEYRFITAHTKLLAWAGVDGGQWFVSHN